MALIFMLDTGNDDNEEAEVLTINMLGYIIAGLFGFIMTGFGLSCR